MDVFYEEGNQWDTQQFKMNSKGQQTMIGVTGRHFGPAFDGSSIENFDYTMVPYTPVEDNFTDAYDLGFNTNTNVSVQGGNEKTNFYTSLSYKYANGTTPNNSFSRLSFCSAGKNQGAEQTAMKWLSRL